MKKYILSFIILLMCPFIINAERIKVSLEKCVDGDTAWFLLDGESIKTRFLAIDTPETVDTSKKVEPYGKEASNYTCDSLKKANTIEIEYDEDSDKTDKYDRHLVWIFIDNSLLQDELVKQGYAEVKYIYGDYKYLDTLYSSQKYAQNNQLGIWGDYVNTDYITYILIGVVIIYSVIQIIRKKKIKKSTIKKILKGK